MIKTVLAAALTIAAIAPAEAATTVTGAATGVFNNAMPSTATTTGSGTSVFTYGEGDPTANRLTFVGSPFSGALGTAFKVGRLSYVNGITVADTEANSVDLALTFLLTSPKIVSTTTTLALGLVSTPNVGTEDENADYVYLPTVFQTTTFSYMGQTYDFAITGFGNVVGDGFLASNSSQLHVREGGTASADLFARVSVAAVPEPATWAMMLVGFAAVGVAARRSRRVAARVSCAA